MDVVIKKINETGHSDLSPAPYLTSRSTQPSHPNVGSAVSSAMPMGSDALQLGSKGMYKSCLVTGKTAQFLAKCMPNLSALGDAQ